VTSIRRHLLLSMAIAVLAAGCLAAAGVYLKVRQEVGELFDYQLRQMALSLRDQAQRGNLRFDPPRLRSGLDFAIQISSDDGFLLYYSQGNVRLPSRPREGYTSLETPQGLWRVYALRDDGLTLQVAQPVPMREQLARKAAVRTIVPFLLTLPVLGALLWLAINRALKPLEALTHAVRARTPSSLHPLSENSAPEEVRPLIAALNDLLGRLARAIEVQSNFVADAAHELRSPLTALRLQVQLAERATRADERAAAFEMLKQGLERAAHLVEQLLTLAREDPSAGERMATDVDLGALAAEIVGRYSALAETRSIDLGLARRDADVRVRGASDALSILASNLVDNAVRNTPAGGRIDVSVLRDAQAVRLEVANNGPGIPSEDRERVFDRFYRRPDAETAGSGLGLAIVRSIAQRHGARVELQDNPAGRGLLVRVIFPLLSTA
jgi:two-component system OmpR family sensor kinase